MKPRQPAFQSLPDPSNEILTSCVVQSINFVQVIMIQLLPKGLERVGDLGVVDKPTGFRINLAAHRDLASERMTVQPRAFVFGRNHWQPVGRFKSELLYKVNDHSQPILASAGDRSQMSTKDQKDQRDQKDQKDKKDQ